MAEVLPAALSWLDAKKHQAAAELATALAGAGTDPIFAAARDLARNLTGAFPTLEQREQSDAAASVMPQVSGPARVERSRQMMSGFGVSPLSVHAFPGAKIPTYEVTELFDPVRAETPQPAASALQPLGQLFDLASRRSMARIFREALNQPPAGGP